MVRPSSKYDLKFDNNLLSQKNIITLEKIFGYSQYSENDTRLFLEKLNYTCSPSLVGERLEATLKLFIEYGNKLIQYFVDKGEDKNIIEQWVPIWEDRITQLEKRITSPPINNVTIDFGQLTETHVDYINDCFIVDSSYDIRNWVSRYKSWLNANFILDRRQFILTKTLEYGKKRNQHYIDIECKHGVDCITRKAFEDKIQELSNLIAKEMQLVTYSKTQDNIETSLNGLPHWMINEIKNSFGKESIEKNKSYKDWTLNFKSALDNIENQKKTFFLQRCIDYSKNTLWLHIHNDCLNPIECKIDSLLIHRISYVQGLLDNIDSPVSDSDIKFAGTKIDLIRILNALWELKKIETLHGQTPTKEIFMKSSGKFFNTELEGYEMDLSQAYNNGKTETNLNVFNEMIAITKKICFEKEK